MAEQQPAIPGAANDGGMQFSIDKIYVKDLSLENPGAPLHEKFDVALGPEHFHAMQASQEREGPATLARS